MRSIWDGFTSVFQSTLPGWGATYASVRDLVILQFQSTLPGWGATDVANSNAMWQRISIHAPRMGSDGCRQFQRDVAAYFNPRSPDGERPGRVTVIRRGGHFNPRSPDGERHARQRLAQAGFHISIHAPRMGSDFPSRRFPRTFHVFQSTLPGWGATYAAQQTNWANEFQSTLPGWGATGKRARMRSSSSVFQSTLPGWGATLAEFGVCLVAHISIHAPRMRSDEHVRHQALPWQHISIHAPRMGSDDHMPVHVLELEPISIHAPRMGSDPRIVMS